MFYDGAHLDVFFRRFGQTVTYTAAEDGEEGTTGVNILGILDEPGTMQLIGRVPVQVTKRRVTVKTSDVPTPSMNDKITIGSTAYYVSGHDPDGTGMTVLTLSNKVR